MGLYQTKIFWTAKKITNKRERPLSEWKKTFANNISDNRLISKRHKELQVNTNQKKKNNNMIKNGLRLKETCFQRRHTNGQQACARMLNITNHERNANQTTMNYHLTPVRMAIFKKTINNNGWRGCRERGTLGQYCGQCKLLQSLWKTVQGFSKS